MSESGPSGFQIATLTVSICSTLATLFVGVAALIVSTRGYRLNRRIHAQTQAQEERRRRIEFGIALKNWSSAQFLDKLTGDWTLMNLPKHGGSELFDHAAATDSPNASKLFSWMYLYISLLKFDPDDTEETVKLMTSLNDPVDAWIDDPSTADVLPPVSDLENPPMPPIA